jgi:xylulokinase
MLTLDVKNKKWSSEMLEACGIKEEQMPKLFESYEPVGKVLPHIADQLGLGHDVTVAAGAGDNAGAAIGTSTVGEGRCNISLGTSGTVFISSEKFGVDPHNALHSFCHADGGYHLMGCMLSAALCNMWFCGEILNTTDYSGEQAQITEDMLGNNQVFFLPYLMGERSPINDTDATGMFIGLRPNTKRNEMLLAVLEGVAFGIRDSIEVAKSLGIDIKTSTVCGGGAKSELWLKILANILNIELCVPVSEEGPGAGATILAMVAAGEYGSVEEVCSRFVQVKETVFPDPELVGRYEKRYQQFRKIYPACQTLFSELVRG